MSDFSWFIGPFVRELPSLCLHAVLSKRARKKVRFSGFFLKKGRMFTRKSSIPYLRNAPRKRGTDVPGRRHKRWRTGIRACTRGWRPKRQSSAPKHTPCPTIFRGTFRVVPLSCSPIFDNHGRTFLVSVPKSVLLRRKKRCL